MAKGSRQVFKIPLFLNISQKQNWMHIQSQAKTLYKLVAVELKAEEGSLGFIVAKEFFVARIKRCVEQDSLDDITFNHAIEWSYDRCRNKTTAIGRRSVNVPIKIDQKSVIFSITEEQIKIPYLGLVRCRKNKLITPGREASANDKERQWLLNNIRAMFIHEVNNDTCVIIDCSEGGADSTGESLLTGKSVTKKKKAISKWLE